MFVSVGAQCVLLIAAKVFFFKVPDEKPVSRHERIRTLVIMIYRCQHWGREQVRRGILEETFNREQGQRRILDQASLP